MAAGATACRDPVWRSRGGGSNRDHPILLTRADIALRCTDETVVRFPSGLCIDTSFGSLTGTARHSLGLSLFEKPALGAKGAGGES